jgi:hypothetical protein
VAYNKFLETQMNRLQIPEDQRDEWSKNIMDFSRQVRHIESDNNPKAAAGTTSAKGVYQFTDDSVTTGKNRMANMGFGQDVISAISDNPMEWDDEQADSMFFANIFAQKGSDDFLRRVGGGDMQARKDAYYKFHHTDPDEATTRRVDEIINIPGEHEMNAKKPKDATNAAMDLVEQTMLDADRAESAFTKQETEAKTDYNAWDASIWDKDWRG